MKKVSLIIFVLMSITPIFSMKIENIKLTGYPKKFTAQITVSNIDTTKIKYKTLYNPLRVYVDFYDTKKIKISNFIRKFNKELPITSIRSYYHKTIGNKQSVTRVVFDLNENLVKSTKVIKNSQGKVYAISYLREQLPKIVFSWSTDYMNKVTFKKPTKQNNQKLDKKAKKEILPQLLDVDFASIGNQNDVIFSFNKVLSNKNISIDTSGYIIIKFKSDINNKKFNNYQFSNNNFTFNSIEFLGKIDNMNTFKIGINNNLDVSNIVTISKDNKFIITAIDNHKKPNFIGSLALLKKSKFTPIKTNTNDNNTIEIKKPLVKTLIAQNKKIDSTKYIKIIAKSAKIRKGPDSKFDIIGTAKKGEIYEKLLEKENYIKIAYKNEIGWLYKSTTKNLKDKIKTRKNDNINFNGVKIKYYAKRKTSIRVEPDLKSKKIGFLNKGDTIEVIDKSGDWFNVIYKEKSAWVYTKNLIQTNIAKLIFKNSNNQTKITDSSSIIPNTKHKYVFNKYKKVGPFIPRLKKRTLESGPNVEDLELVGIIYDDLDKIALFQSKNKILEKSIFTMREGDNVKNGKLYKIKKDKVIFMLTIFGVTKTYIIKLETKKQ